MKIRLLFLFLFVLSFSYSQENDSLIRKNILKTNLTSIAINNYSFQYERVLNKRFSASISYRFMPDGNIPFQDNIADAFSEDDNYLGELFNSISVSNYAITPEIRFYLGKGYGKGFYIAAYYRYNNIDVNSIDYSFDSELDGSKITVSGSGNFTSHSGGIMFGAQWNLSKRIVLDWWIVGAHIGTLKGELNGVSSESLSEIDQQYIDSDLSGIDLYDINVSVTSDQVKAKVKGPSYGIRAGLSIGYRF